MSNCRRKSVPSILEQELNSGLRRIEWPQEETRQDAEVLTYSKLEKKEKVWNRRARYHPASSGIAKNPVETASTVKELEVADRTTHLRNLRVMK